MLPPVRAEHESQHQDLFGSTPEARPLVPAAAKASDVRLVSNWQTVLPPTQRQHSATGSTTLAFAGIFAESTSSSTRSMRAVWEFFLGLVTD